MHNNISLYSFQPAHHKSCHRFASCLSADSVKIQQAHRLIFLRTLLSGEVFRLHVLQLFVEIALRVKKPTSRSANTDVTDPVCIVMQNRQSFKFVFEKNSSIFSWCSTNNRDCPSLLSFCRAKNSAVQSPCMLRKETFPKTHHPL